MKIITIGNIKGGTGKTTTAINIASQLATHGYKVLLVDNDAQCNITQCLLYDVEVEQSLYDIYTDKNVGFNECIFEYSENFFIVPNTIKSSRLEMELNQRMNRESILVLKKDTIPDIIDFVIIDNSPFLGLLFQNSLTLSDWYIPVLDNSSSSLQGFNMLQDVVQEISENRLNKNIRLLGVLRNRFDKTTNFTNDFNFVLNNTLTTGLFQTIIYNSIKYKEAYALHKPISLHDKKAALPYSILIEEILNRLGVE